MPGGVGRCPVLAVRIADDSNLALDPDLDTYYVQDTVVSKLPFLLGQLGEARSLVEPCRTGSALRGVDMRFLVLDGLPDRPWARSSQLGGSISRQSRRKSEAGCRYRYGGNGGEQSAYLDGVGRDIGAGETSRSQF